MSEPVSTPPVQEQGTVKACKQHVETTCLARSTYQRCKRERAARPVKVEMPSTSENSIELLAPSREVYGIGSLLQPLGRTCEPHIHVLGG